MPAKELIRHFETDWNGDVTRVFGEYGYSACVAGACSGSTWVWPQIRSGIARKDAGEVCNCCSSHPKADPSEVRRRRVSRRYESLEFHHRSQKDQELLIFLS